MFHVLRRRGKALVAKCAETLVISKLSVWATAARFVGIRSLYLKVYILINIVLSQIRAHVP